MRYFALDCYQRLVSGENHVSFHRQLLFCTCTKSLKWNPQTSSIIGYADISVEQKDKNADPLGKEKLSTQALSFKLVSLKGVCRPPMGYFLSNHFTAAEGAALVREAFKRTTENNILVRAVIFDGLATNIDLANDRGIWIFD